MAALTANTTLQIRNAKGDSILDGVILTSAVIYQHAMVVRTAAGLLKPAADETTTRFVGLCDIIENPDDDTAGITGDGTLRANCVSELEALVALVTAITVGNVGSLVYAADDQTVTTETTLGPAVGVLVEFVAANSGWVRFGASALAAAS